MAIEWEHKVPEIAEKAGVPLDSAFYVERPPIEDCYEAISRDDALIASNRLGRWERTPCAGKFVQFIAGRRYNPRFMSSRGCLKISIAFNKMSVPLRSAKLTVWQAQTGNFAKL
jgi:hypothetical protein